MKDFKKEVYDFMAERDWLRQPVSNVAKSILIEGGELLEHFQWNDHTAEEIKADPPMKQEIADELADVFIYATEMAILLDCDVADIIHQKLLKAGKKYPVGVVNGKLGSKKYLAIKRDYRAKQK